MLVLRERDVLGLLSNLTVVEGRRFLDRLHSILREYAEQQKNSDADSNPKQPKTIHQPERTVIVTDLGSTSLFMPSSVTTSTGVKVVTLSQPAGLKGAVNLFSPDGTLLGLLNAEELTAFRTALAVMIPFVRWYRHSDQSLTNQSPSSGNMVVFGAGRQAEWHVKLALLLGGSSNVKQVSHITVVNRSSPRRMEQLFDTLKPRYPDVTFQILLKADPDYDARLRRVLEAADVVCGCTPSPTPHFPYSYLTAQEKPRFISLIGSYKPSMHEVDTETLLSGDGGDIYVDTRHACLAEAGELITAKVRPDQLIEIGELGDDTPLNTDANLVFKCVGLGIMDIVMAGELLTLAKEKGVGLVVDDF
jgi:ornithine cyclodeaminase